MSADDVIVRIGASIDDMKSELGKARAEIRQFAEEAKKAAEGAANPGLGGLKGLIAQYQLLQTGTQMLDQAIRAAVANAIEFEYVLDRLGTIVGKSGGELARLGDEVVRTTRELKLGVSSIEAIEGMSLAASSGFDSAADSANVMRAALVGAKAGATDTKSAVDVLTTILQAYQLESSEAARVTDMLVATADAGKAEFPQLAHNLGQVISTASTAKVPLEEMLGAIAQLSLTMPASEAVTALNAGIIALLAPTDQAAKNLAALHLSADDVRRTLKEDGLPAALQMVADAAKGNESTLRNLVGDTNALKAVFALTGDNAADLAKRIEQVDNSAGVALGKARQASDNLKTSFEDLKQAGLDLVNQLGGPALEGVNAYVKGLRDAAVEIGRLIDGLNPDQISDAAQALTGIADIDVEGLLGGKAGAISDEINKGILGSRLAGLNDAILFSWVRSYQLSLVGMSEEEQKFLDRHREAMSLFGKSAPQLIDMGATQQQIQEAIALLAMLQEVSLRLGDEERAKHYQRQLENLANIRQTVEEGVAARKAGAAAVAEAEDAAASQRRAADQKLKDEGLALVASLKEAKSAGAYETAQAEIAAIDAVLAHNAIGEENRKALALQRAGLVKKAADEETAAALRSLDHRSQREKLSAEQQLAIVRQVLESHRGSLATRQQLEDQIVALEAKAAEERIAAEQKAIDDKVKGIEHERNMRRASGQATLDDEVAFQQRIVATYKRGTDERMKAEEELAAAIRRRQEAEEEKQRKLADLQAQIAGQDMGAIDDQIADIERRRDAEIDAIERTTTDATKAAQLKADAERRAAEEIIALKRERLRLEQEIIDAETAAANKEETDPEVRKKREELAERKKADAARDAEREIGGIQESQKKRAGEVAAANEKVADSYREIGDAAKQAKEDAAPDNMARGGIIGGYEQFLAENNQFSAGFGKSPFSDSAPSSTSSTASTASTGGSPPAPASSRDDAFGLGHWGSSVDPASRTASTGAPGGKMGSGGGNGDVVAAIQAQTTALTGALQGIAPAIASAVSGAVSRAGSGGGKPAGPAGPSDTQKQASSGRAEREASMLAGYGN